MSRPFSRAVLFVRPQLPHRQPQRQRVGRRRRSRRTARALKLANTLARKRRSMTVNRLLYGVFAVSCSLAACSGTATSSCGSVAPVPVPSISLAYPVAGAGNVSTDLGDVIFAGMSAGATVYIRSNLGPVAVGSPTAAPSPLPTPNATPSDMTGAVQYFAIPVPTLASTTTYSVSYAYSAFNGIPPACSGQVTVNLGSFTTQ
jgi:hypothetical protein